MATPQTSETTVSGFANLSDMDIVGWLPSTPPDARIHYSSAALTYGDLRLPRGDDADGHPLVILIHGGAWESSYTSDYVARLAESLTALGVATWNLEFRRLNNPGSDYPGMFLDISQGVDFARELAKDYPIDLDRVVLLGHSSGGHLATWAAGRKNISPESPLYSEDPLRVSGVVDLAGVLDLEYAYNAGRTDVLQVVGAHDSAALREKAGDTSSIRLLPLGVPQSLIIGTADNPWRLESHQRYRDAGMAGGDRIDLIRLEGANHFDVVDVSSPAWEPIVTAVREYAGLPKNGATDSIPAVSAN
ncbi:alpha/beta hydrolase [Microbacterium sp. LWS13-1.2]|uniref:Alpha/beta hydrolase n=1 Tax=Microbacterium sp. LWS13-1.2 TaxID=3135264 RepID=A0AAU6SBK1_9MICO